MEIDVTIANIQIVIMIMIVLLSLVGGYFQLKVVAGLKKGHGRSVWSGRWLFHSEWLDESGRKARKQFIFIFLIEFVLLAIFFATTQS